ncbi:MAG: DUF4230 domain-containing protein [Chloroflexota bacterium]
MSNIDRDPRQPNRPNNQPGTQRGLPPALQGGNRNRSRPPEELTNHPGFRPQEPNPNYAQPPSYSQQPGYSPAPNQNRRQENKDYQRYGPPAAGRGGDGSQSIPNPGSQYELEQNNPSSGYIPPQNQLIPAQQGAGTHNLSPNPSGALPSAGPPPSGPPPSGLPMGAPPRQARQAYYPPGSNLGEPIRQGSDGSVLKTILKILGWTALLALIMTAIVLGTSWWTLRSTTSAILNTDTTTTIVAKSPVISSLKKVNKQILIEHNNMVDVDYTEAPEGWLSYLPIEQSFVVLLRGTVPAGFDLSTLSEDDIWISEDGTKIQLILPPPIIFEDSVAVNFEESRVLIEGDTCPDFLCAENLEAIQKEIIPQGRAMLMETSINSGIIEQAAEMGIHYYESLLRSLDFDEVQVLIQGDVDVSPRSE